MDVPQTETLAKIKHAIRTVTYHKDVLQQQTRQNGQQHCNDTTSQASNLLQETEEEVCPPPPPPGRQRHYSAVLEKLAIVRNVLLRKIDMGMSQHAACEDYVFRHHTMYGVWARKIQQMQHARNNKARSLCPSPPEAVLQPMQDELLRFIFELHEQGMPVSISIMVALKASQISPVFSQKSRIVKFSAVASRRFVRVHGLVHRLGADKSQRSPHGNCRRCYGLYDNSCATQSP
jgi:hypothetical protein